MGRPLKFDKDDVLSKAMYLFWENGYDGTSTDDLEAATGIKRGSLYNTFENKHQLYLTVLNHYLEIKMRQTIDIVREHKTLSKSVQALMKHVASEANVGSVQRGCLLCDAAVDRAPRDAEVATIVKNAFNSLSNAIAHTIKTTFGDISSDSAKSEADRIVALYIGFRTYLKIGHPEAMLQRTGAREVAHMIRFEKEKHSNS